MLNGAAFSNHTEDMWQSLSIAEKKVDVFDPPTQPRFGLIFLHGIGLETLIDNTAYTSLLTKYRCGCACPHGQRSWWLDRICPEFDQALTPEAYILGQIVPWCRERWRLGSRSVGIFGISMGGQGAIRMALRDPHTFPVAAGIASALDFHEVYGQGTPLDEMFDSRERCRQDTALMHIPRAEPYPRLFFCIDPDDELWYRGNDRLHEKLTAMGVPHTCDLTTRGGGHSWTYFNRMAEATLRFLVDSLATDSLRLL